MSFDAETLYKLVPALYRLRDADRGEPLRGLLTVIAEQAQVLEENLAQLYDDQFIETCSEWVAPYIGDLIGYRPLHGVTPEISSPRAEVANTIAYRRRKGTAAVLEQLARDVTGWDARAVEMFQLLGWTQHMNHVRSGHAYAPDMRRWQPLERLDGPFDRLAHTIDIRRVATGRGKHNIRNVAIFLWRLDDYRLRKSPAVEVDSRRYMFSPLGHDMQLFTFAESEKKITHIAKPINVPDPISRRVLDDALATYYGEGKSIYITVAGSGIDSTKVRACDLSDAGAGSWAHQPQSFVAIDPVLGRIAFPSAESAPAEPPKVTFHYGFSAELGGGEYDRLATMSDPMTPFIQVASPAAIQPSLGSSGGTIEVTDSDRYQETLSIQLDPGSNLELRAGNAHRPTVVLSGDLEIRGDADNEVVLDGLLISGARLLVPSDGGNAIRRLRLRHCTLVPGLSLDRCGHPQHPTAPSLVVDLANVTAEIDHCIVGGLRVVEGSTVRIADSIVDATSDTGVAYAAPDDTSAGGALTIESSTVIGKVHTRLLELASNTVFYSALATADTWLAALRSEQKQTGCVRFSFVPAGSRVPRRYRCQPDLAIHEAISAALEADPLLSSAERASIAEGVLYRMLPVFTDLRYGQPAYCQLHTVCPIEIRTGADDESEMGAFHDCYAPQKETNLRLRLEEYLRFGLEAGIFYAT
jgi:hypothetical protein